MRQYAVCRLVLCTLQISHAFLVTFFCAFAARVSSFVSLKQLLELSWGKGHEICAVWVRLAAFVVQGLKDSLDHEVCYWYCDGCHGRLVKLAGDPRFETLR